METFWHRLTQVHLEKWLLNWREIPITIIGRADISDWLWQAVSSNLLSMLRNIVEWIVQFIVERVANWIIGRGGWVSRVKSYPRCSLIIFPNHAVDCLNYLLIY